MATTLMASSGTTSDNNEITEEDNISQNQTPPLPRFSPHSPQETGAMTSLSTESGGNINHEDRVTLFVAYDGKWEYDSKEWIFKNSKGSMFVVLKHITLSEITEILYDKFYVNKWLYRLKLEVHWTGSPWFPLVEIQNDKDLSVFISETSKKELPLCVTRLKKDETDVDEERRKDYANVFVAYNGKWEKDDKERMIFKNSKSSTIFVTRCITLSEITDILYEHLDVDKQLYRLKLEVNHETEGHRLSGIKIQSDFDLSEFISETSETKLLLCVTRIYDAISSDDAGERPKGTVTIFVACDGKWEYNGEEWFFKNSTLGKMLDVPKHITLSEITDIISDKFHINRKFYGLKLEVHYRSGSPWFPIIQIGNDRDLSQFISETSKTKVPLCVTVLDQDYVPDFDEEERRKDVAYELINNYPRMAAQVFGKDDTPLLRIVRKPDLFYSGTHYNLYQRFVYRHVPIEHNSLGSTDTADIENNSLGGTDSTADIENNSLGGTNTAVVENQETPKRRCLHDVIWRIWVKLWKTTLLHVPHVKHLKDDKVKHNTTIKLLRRICEEVDRRNTSSDIQRLFSSPFCLAVENNTDEAIDVLTTYFRGLYNSVKDGHDIYQLTVLNRSEKVYIFIMNHKRDAISDLATIHDNDDNNILHFAGRLAPIHKLNVASGAALQMQRELQWFEEVKRVVGKLHTLNKNKETPMMVFRKEHKELRKDGEEWMKKTADSYTITAALIITIVFAAAITVPGGNDSATGKPIYETKASLIIFAISDAISLFTSTTSLLLFLSILTARYADEDFLYKLPKRLIYGLVMLFVSVTSMMIAFSATLYIMFGQGKAWILIPIAALACLPIASFVTLQFPLLQELISSTYGHGMFGKEKDYRQSSANANKKKRA